MGTGGEKKIGNKGWELRLGKGAKKQKRGKQGFGKIDWERVEKRGREQQLRTGVREQRLTTGVDKIDWEQG